MKKWLWVIAILLVIVLLNPLWWPVQCIRAYVFLYAPVGTSMERVEKRINQWLPWEIRWISYESGYEANENGELKAPYVKEVGTQHMRIHLGGYKVLFVDCDVVALLGFDENGKLIDIGISKEYDSL